MDVCQTCDGPPCWEKEVEDYTYTGIKIKDLYFPVRLLLRKNIINKAEYKALKLNNVSEINSQMKEDVLHILSKETISKISSYCIKQTREKLFPKPPLIKVNITHINDGVKGTIFKDGKEVKFICYTDRPYIGFDKTVVETNKFIKKELQLLDYIKVANVRSSNYYKFENKIKFVVNKKRWRKG